MNPKLHPTPSTPDNPVLPSALEHLNAAEFASTEYLPVLLGAARATEFATQHPRFMDLWTRRWNAVSLAMDTKVTALDDPSACQPEVVDALTRDDTDPPTLVAFADDLNAPPTVSARRMQAFGDAIWAVYNMREMWRSLGPRIDTVHKVATPGRNDACACGSGKKYKKCCGLLSIA